MPYPSPFLRLVASGTLHDVESFSYSLSLVPDFPSGDAVDGPETIPQGVIDAVASFHTSTASTAAKLTTLKLNMIGTNGRYLNEEASVAHDYGNPGVSSTSAARYPPQVALAVSLMTASSRGLAHAGRFYIPSPFSTIDTDGRVPAGQINNTAAAAVELVNAINTAVDGYVVGVASDTREGKFRMVTGVRIGRVLDTIRSRRTSMPEGYVTASGEID